MTTLALERSCMFCGRSARRRPAPGEFPAHDFDCVQCGRYRVGETAEARMRGNGMTMYDSVRPKIIGANKEGYRLVLPSCFCVPFSEERALSVVANADGRSERDADDRFESRPSAASHVRLPMSGRNLADGGTRTSA
jgi:hypothetical protein